MRRRIFVFGSNIQGAHAGGAAAYAMAHHGADLGIAEGLAGDSYALPTCDWNGRELKPLPLPHIEMYVKAFREFARSHPELDFLVTAVGCGIAGYKPCQVADLFSACPDNVYFQARLAYGFT